MMNHSFGKLGGAAWFWAAWDVCHNADGRDDALVARAETESAGVVAPTVEAIMSSCDLAFSDSVVCTGRHYATSNVSGMHAVRIVAAVLLAVTATAVTALAASVAAPREIGDKCSPRGSANVRYQGRCFPKQRGTPPRKALGFPRWAPAAPGRTEDRVLKVACSLASRLQDASAD
jgi:hypothetical protein